MDVTRRTTISALSLFAASALGACGGSSGGASNSASGASSSPASAGSSSGSATAGTATAALSGKVTVFAAASLQKAFEQLATDFKQAHPGVEYSFDFQGSQDLVTALAEGAAADILATANNKTMQDATGKGLVAKSQEFATNVLTLIVPKGNPAHVTGINDGSLDQAKLVVCAPQVPCGAATQKLTAELGISLNPVSEEQKVTDVRGKVESGEADAGLVYTTDAKSSGEKVEAVALPANQVKNHYPVAVTKTATNPQAAQAFVDHLLSPAGQKVLQEQYGFGAPEAK
ncbi:Molybdate-binding periplasmic protein precursor [Actinomyces bovis]|uniref:Molybdate-binding periplasmic protein n=1 Tax=Actinomyces bovis TaxID=1658 RepID=A0ABY1VMM9_9ACTO|nr:molybdate ABC transporter substrate-binding protein [Actinomyces bovis]SPT53359.1 Molybdate-binding periplasmic protein precursor [Actinomyces bovis]VEG52732.1 Molybdate-binding periplasmic protein precursor [Actinomyces israelii]